ncbi:MAG: hypothetical protein JNL02_20145 [Saprospiraceae bacterium]|nr:hypothetical protein [Saprospiraceae bacterium]
MIQPPHFDRDDLEQHLRSELRDYAPEAPDRLWEGIEARLPQRRRRPVIWWWLTGVAMAGLFAGMAYRFKGDKYIAQHIPVPMAQPLSAVTPVGHSILQSTAGSAPAILAGLPAPEQTDRRKNGVARATPLVGLRSDAAITPQTYSQLLNGQAPGLDNDVRPAALLSMAALSALEFENKSRLRQWARTSHIKPLRDTRWAVGVLAGPVWLWQQDGGASTGYTNHLAFAEQSEGPATGWQTGLYARFDLHPRWQLSAGIGRRTTTQVASHTAELRLTDAVCLNPYDPGPKLYEFQYNLHSSGNESSLTVRIAQVDTMNTMPADEPFLLNMHTSRQRTDWVVPLTLLRSFGSGRWQGFVEGGGALNIPGSINVQVEHFSEACADLCFEASHMPTLTSQDRGNVSFSWLLGAGVDYRLGRRLSLSLAPSVFGQKGQTGLVLNGGVLLRL